MSPPLGACSGCVKSCGPGGNLWGTLERYLGRTIGSKDRFDGTSQEVSIVCLASYCSPLGWK